MSAAHIVELVVGVSLAVGVIVAIVSHLGHGVATQDRDPHVEASGPLPRRRFWSRRSRPHAGPVNPGAIASADETRSGRATSRSASAQGR